MYFLHQDSNIWFFAYTQSRTHLHIDISVQWWACSACNVMPTSETNKTYQGTKRSFYSNLCDRFEQNKQNNPFILHRAMPIHFCFRRQNKEKKLNFENQLLKFMLLFMPKRFWAQNYCKQNRCKEREIKSIASVISSRFFLTHTKEQLKYLHCIANVESATSFMTKWKVIRWATRTLILWRILCKLHMLVC